MLSNTLIKSGGLKATFFDNFERANGGLSAGSPFWTRISGTGTEPGAISGGQCITQNTNAATYQSPSMKSKNHFAEFTIRRTSSANNILGCRVVGQDLVGVRWDSITLYLTRRSGGSVDLVTLSRTMVVGDIIRVSTKGNAVSIVLNGTPVPTMTNVSLGGLVATGNNPGFYTINSLNPWFDNYKTGTL